MLAQVLLTFILVIVGVNLVPSVADTVYTTTCNWNGSECFATNVTGASVTLINLVPLFFVISIVVVTVQSSVSVLQKMGM